MSFESTLQERTHPETGDENYGDDNGDTAITGEVIDFHVS